MFSFKGFATLTFSSVLVACSSASHVNTTPIPDSFTFTPTNPHIVEIAKGVPPKFSFNKPVRITMRKPEYKDGMIWVDFTTDDGKSYRKTAEEFDKFEEEISYFSVPSRPVWLDTRGPDVKAACKKLRAELMFIRSGNKLFVNTKYSWKDDTVFTKNRYYRNAIKCFETDKITFHDIYSGRKLTIPAL